MQHVPPPPPSLNGGLYTGQPFASGAPWANVPVTPEGTYMTHVNLRSARPPPGAEYQYAGSIRPGNNFQAMPGVRLLSDQHAALCAPMSCPSQPAVGPRVGVDQRFTSFYHLR
jgi:hypothetical protein